MLKKTSVEIAADLIPCETCRKQIPFSQYQEHYNSHLAPRRGRPERAQHIQLPAPKQDRKSQIIPPPFPKQQLQILTQQTITQSKSMVLGPKPKEVQPQIPKQRITFKAVLNIAFVGDRTGQSMQMENINQKMTYVDVANYILQQLDAEFIKMSFVAENGNAIQLYMNRQGIKEGNGQERVELLTGFFSTQLSCKVNKCIPRGQILVYLDEDMTKYVGIPFQVEDKIVELKRKISQKLSIPVEKQRMELKLGYKKVVLQNNSLLRDKQISQDSEIFLLTEPRDIQIRMPNSQTVKLSVQNDEKVGDVSIRACREAKINPDGLFLYKDKIKLDENLIMGDLEWDRWHDDFTIEKKMIFVIVKTPEEEKS
ncbi:MAG: hypothetical protein EZS28_034148, partial [Streblomastix strix]